MSDLLGIVTVAETALLAGVLISQARLRIRLRHLGERTSATAAQMREVVQEAQSLSAALAARLAEPAAAMDGHAGYDGVAGGRIRAVGRDEEARPMVPTAWVPLVARGMAAAGEDPAADRAAARAKGMDPVGVAIQRRLVRRDPQMA